MKRWILAGFAALLVMSVAPSSHATGFISSGTLRVALLDGAGDTGIIGTREEARARGVNQVPQCGPSNPLNGIEQQWYNVSLHPLHPVSITPTGVTEFTSDFDGWFFTSACALIPGADMAEGVNDNSTPPPGQLPGQIPFTQLGDPENGTVPATASWMVVVLYEGANATYNISY